MTIVETITKPIEVRLGRPHLEVTCRIVFPGGTAIAVGVDALSIPVAQREITAWLAEVGYEPTGPWSAQRGCRATRTFRCQGPGSALPGPPPSTPARPRPAETEPDRDPGPRRTRPPAPRIPRATSARRAGRKRATSPHGTEAELRAWALANARRDEVIRAAAAAGISVPRIEAITGIARTTVMRILGTAPRSAPGKPR